MQIFVSYTYVVIIHANLRGQQILLENINFKMFK